MTINEIAKLFDCSEIQIRKYFKKAKEHNPEFAKKGRGCRYNVIDYTLEECLYALSFNSVFTPMRARILREYYDKTRNS